jgi:hypothetical protein
MTAAPQATFVVEYPCDRFCRIEVDLSGESNEVTLRQMRQMSDRLHEQEHEPKLGEPAAPVAEQEHSGRPAATVFLSAPGRGNERRR